MAYVNGYAFAAPEAVQEHRDAWDRVKHIKGAILSDRSTYGRRTKTIDTDLTKGLTDLEKLVLADGGPSPFGGEVTSTTVVVYTD